MGVYLNERLVLHFSEPLDPDSVHTRSVRVVADDGSVARGRWIVNADRLEFVPAPVLARDRSDGGYRPGAEHSIELAGFPRVDGLRGESGSLLPESLRWTFRTVDLADAQRGPVFEDSSPTLAYPVILRTPMIRPLEPIQLHCEEPLDPSTVDSADFELLPRLSFELLGRTRGDAIAMVARLVRNEERQPYRTDAAIIELVPRDRRLAPGEYGLSVKRDAKLRDFGGHPTRVLNANFRADSLFVRVQAGARAADERIGRHVESFLDTRHRSLDPHGGSDGTALWSGNGRVEVRWPAAAGDGSAGAVELEGAVLTTDVHAARLHLASDATAEIENPRGLVVLRSQGRFEIDGDLVRGSVAVRPSAEESAQRLCALEEWLAHARSTARPGEWSTALAELAARDIDATVLIAGGDLVLKGNVRSESPLILVAGGLVRVSNAGQIRAPLLLFADAGSPKLDYTELVDGRASSVGADRFPWILDTPRDNPLVRPLRFSVWSTSIPGDGEQAARWMSEPLVSSHHGHGWANVTYLGEHRRDAGERPRTAFVEDPAALVDCPTVRLLIELDLFPGTAWDPPWVDDVSLEFEPRANGRTR